MTKNHKIQDHTNFNQSTTFAHEIPLKLILEIDANKDDDCSGFFVSCLGCGFSVVAQTSNISLMVV